jgi:hypothetical protein
MVACFEKVAHEREQNGARTSSKETWVAFARLCNPGVSIANKGGKLVGYSAPSQLLLQYIVSGPSAAFSTQIPKTLDCHATPADTGRLGIDTTVQMLRPHTTAASTSA